MRVLVACEFSGVVRDAFTRCGHEAWSCDLLPTEQPGLHIEGGVLEIPSSTMSEFDLLISHPPCTHLAASGARWWSGLRNQEQEQATEFVRRLLALPVGRVAVENPVGALSRRLRKPDQIIQPWMFGHGESKATCLWLTGLPPLIPTRIVEGREARSHMEAPGGSEPRWKRRSRTLPGIAAAMAEQWGALRDWRRR